MVCFDWILFEDIDLNDDHEITGMMKPRTGPNIAPTNPNIAETSVLSSVSK